MFDEREDSSLRIIPPRTGNTGRSANLNGHHYERQVSLALEDLGYGVLRPEKGRKTHNFRNLSLSGPYPFYAYKVQCMPHLWKHRRGQEADHIAYHPQKLPNGLLIECKSQTQGGSVDEKLFVKVENMKLFPGIKMMMLGGAFDNRFWEDFVPFLKDQAGPDFHIGRLDEMMKVLRQLA